MSQGDGDISQLSSKEWVSSLGDDELIAFLNQWSQKKKKEQTEPKKQELDQVLLQDEEQEDKSESESSFSLPLAQLQDKEVETNEDNNFVFGDYASYFKTKSRNQQVQDEEYVEWDLKRRQVQGLDTQRSTIFQGCIIHVNGHTRPSIATLHKLIILNGGKFVHHLNSKGSVTHIIAERLTPRKELEFRNYKVVGPKWITESIDKGELLRWLDYSVISVDYGQKRLPFGVYNGEQEGDIEEEEEEEEEEEDIAIGPSTQPDEQDESPTFVDSKHPDFLQQFFTKSRLHHLSNWKADLRHEFLQMVLSQPSKPPNRKSPRIILHVDFDCFFATVSALSHPEIQFKTTPVCVSHGGSQKKDSSADIASCNYVARSHGVKNGMWVGSARALCPNLICLDYDFPGYERVSKQFYEILISLQVDSVFPVSIDEALLDISSSIDRNKDVETQVQSFCENLRKLVFEKTQCSVSTGVGPNVLLAKLALRKAKPDGMFRVFNNVEEFLNGFTVDDLPGVGGSIITKLSNQIFQGHDQITVEQLRSVDRVQMEKVFGIKTGNKLYDYSRGIDPTSIDISANPQEFMRKSVSIDINWGIRFDSIDQIDDFLFRVAKEICLKLQKISMLTTHVTLKILKRAKGAPVDPPKYLGCGRCDQFSKSARLGVPSDDYRTIGMECRILFRNIGCDPNELRGVSIQLTKLSEVKDDQQSRLPYKKKKKLGHMEPAETRVVDQEEHGDVSIEITQLDIPDDVDSSILSQLPTQIKQQIINQRRPILSVPSEVDMDVLNELPTNIQAELKDELRRRNIKITPQTPKGNRVYYQQLFGKSGNEPELVRVISKKTSPRKLSPRKLSPNKGEVVSVNARTWNEMRNSERQLEMETLNELPSSLRKSILKEWKEYEDANKLESHRVRERVPQLPHHTSGAVRELHLSDFHFNTQPTPFQRLTHPRAILELIDSWITRTSQKGPHKRDVELFLEYMNLLKDDGNVLYVNIKQRMLLLMRVEEELSTKWIDVIKRL